MSITMADKAVILNRETKIVLWIIYLLYFAYGTYSGSRKKVYETIRELPENTLCSVYT